MNLIVEGRSLQVFSYAMPRVGRALTITVNGEECEAATTKWQEFRNTYFLYKNVPLFVKEHLSPGAVCRLTDVPDNFGAPIKPPVRKSYYTPKAKEPETRVE